MPAGREVYPVLRTLSQEKEKIPCGGTIASLQRKTKDSWDEPARANYGNELLRERVSGNQQKSAKNKGKSREYKENLKGRTAFDQEIERILPHYFAVFAFRGTSVPRKSDYPVDWDKCPNIPVFQKKLGRRISARVLLPVMLSATIRIIG